LRRGVSGNAACWRRCVGWNGTGSGYQTAILAELVAEVYTMETVTRLAKRAETLLDRLGYGNIRFRLDNGHCGWPEAAVSCEGRTLVARLAKRKPANPPRLHL